MMWILRRRKLLENVNAKIVSIPIFYCIFYCIFFVEVILDGDDETGSRKRRRRDGEHSHFLLFPQTKYL